MLSRRFCSSLHCATCRSFPNTSPSARAVVWMKFISQHRLTARLPPLTWPPHCPSDRLSVRLVSLAKIQLHSSYAGRADSSWITKKKYLIRFGKSNYSWEIRYGAWKPPQAYNCVGCGGSGEASPWTLPGVRGTVAPSLVCPDMGNKLTLSL